jgi:ADP-heptose:LPS heptosyltransferase
VAATVHEDESRTLFVVFKRIGDLTLSTPLFRALAKQTRLSLVTRPFGPQLLQGQSYVERVYPLPYPNRGHSAVGEVFLGGHRRALGRELRQVDFDRVLIYEAERGVIKRWLNELFPGRVTEMPYLSTPGIHTSEIYEHAAAALGCSMDAYDAVPVLEVSAAAREAARARLAGLGERVVGVQMGSQRSHAVWPLVPRPHLKGLTAQQWVALLSRLLGEGHADAVTMHGSPREAGMIRAVREQMPVSLRARCHDLTAVGLELLPAVLSQLRALISLDTGPAHIAAAVGVAPVEVLVGSAPCQFCHGTPLYGRCQDNICLNQLTDQQLWDSWSRLRTRLSRV